LIYVVLGMHKSGTTLVSQILHHSGVNMGEEIDPEVAYDQGNKYERPSCLALNLELLGLDGIRAPSLDLPLPPTLQMTESQRGRMREIIRACNQTYAYWGFKDPRTCLVYPLWASELPEHRLVVIYRPPPEVWPRYRQKGLVRLRRNPSRAWTLVKGWCRYNANILTYLQNTTMDFVVLRYRELVGSDAEFRRFEDFVGFELRDQRQPTLYRSRSSTSPLITLMGWLIQARFGWAPNQIIEQLDALCRKGGSVAQGLPSAMEGARGDRPLR
jgi:hypothetical protein